MGILDGVFGSAGGWSGKIKKEGWNQYNQYGALADQAYGPQAYNRLVSGYAEDVGQNLANQSANGYSNLLTRGFRPSSPNLLATTLATNLARQRAMAAQQLMAGRLASAQNRYAMLSQMPWEYNAPVQGAIGPALQAAATAAPLMMAA